MATILFRPRSVNSPVLQENFAARFSETHHRWDVYFYRIGLVQTRIVYPMGVYCFYVKTPISTSALIKAR